MMRPRSVIAAARTMSKSAHSSSLTGRIFLRTKSPTYTATHWAARETTKRTNGWLTKESIQPNYPFPAVDPFPDPSLGALGEQLGLGARKRTFPDFQRGRL